MVDFSYDFTKYKFIFKENALTSIMTAKGWESYADVARETGYTRQYISLIESSKGEITHQFMLALALALGSIQQNWWIHYRIIGVDPPNKNHQRFNYMKHNREIPYRQYSSTAEMRSKDYEVETEEMILNKT